MAATSTETPFVVTGFDGSDSARLALRFAIDEATRRGARLRIVTAWWIPLIVYAAGFTANINATTCEHDADCLSRAAVRMARDLAPGLAVEAVVVDDDPAAALL